MQKVSTVGNPAIAWPSNHPAPERRDNAAVRDADLTRYPLTEFRPTLIFRIQSLRDPEVG